MRINLPLPNARLPASLFSPYLPPPPAIFFPRSLIHRGSHRMRWNRSRSRSAVDCRNNSSGGESGCNRNSREFGALLSESRRFNQRPTENRWRGEREVVRCRDVRKIAMPTATTIIQSHTDSSPFVSLFLSLSHPRSHESTGIFNFVHKSVMEESLRVPVDRNEAPPA